jgi:cardiolipin synthase
VLRRERRRLRAAMANSLKGHGRRHLEDDPATDSAEGQGGRAGRAAAGALRLGRTVGAALTEQRVLATTEAEIVAVVAVVALVLAICAVLWPWLAAIPVALLLGWVSLVLFTRALALRRERRRRGLPTARLERTRTQTPAADPAPPAE